LSGYAFGGADTRRTYYYNLGNNQRTLFSLSALLSALRFPKSATPAEKVNARVILKTDAAQTF
jgi:hypothetical protein